MAHDTIAPTIADFIRAQHVFFVATAPLSRSGHINLSPKGLDTLAILERIGVIEVEAFDWNCPQHITPRFTLEEIEAASKPLHDRIAQLEAEVEALRR